MTNYEVGQIIYTILEEKKIVLPVQVVEQVVVKNLSGEETNYKVLLPNKKSQKVSIERLEKIFNSIDEASNYMLENAKKAIELMAKDAFSLEKEFFYDSIKAAETSSLEEKIDKDILEDKRLNKIKINLPDGQVANIDMSNITEHVSDDSILKEQQEEEIQKKT